MWCKPSRFIYFFVLFFFLSTSFVVLLCQTIILKSENSQGILQRW